MKTLIFFGILLCSTVCFAGQGMIPYLPYKAAGGGGGPTIVAYFNTATNDNTGDYNTSGTSMTKGTGQPGYTSDFTVQNNTPSTGLHALYRAGGNGYQFQIPQAGNFSATLGTGSFFWHATTITALAVPMETDGNASPYLSFLNDDTTHLNFQYMNLSGSNAGGIGGGATVNTTDIYWVSYSIDSANARASLKVYNETTLTWILGTASTWGETTGLSGSAPTGSGSMNFGNANSFQNTQYFSQIMFSAGYQDDHFSKRTNTSP